MSSSPMVDSECTPEDMMPASLCRRIRRGVMFSSAPPSKSEVAVKIIDTAAIKEEYVLRNLQREPRIMARLHHPCIAHLYETMISSSRLYLVTEAAGGGDLCALVRRAPAARLDEARARGLARQLASALRHMHARGVVHRGVIVYGMVTGRLPFVAGRAEGAGERRRALLQHIARGFAPAHRSALTGCSNECIDLIERLLQPDVHQRLNITQTCSHPWIAQQNRHMKTYPLGKITPYAKRAVYQLIADIYNINIAEVDKEIKTDPFGPAGGILNIKTHHQILQQFSNDNVLWSTAKTEPNSPISAPEYKNKILPSPETTTGNRPSTAPSNTNIPYLGNKNSNGTKEKSHFITQAPRYQMRSNSKPKTNATISEPRGNDLFFHFNDLNCQKHVPKKKEDSKTNVAAPVRPSTKNISEKDDSNHKVMEKNKMVWEKNSYDISNSDNFCQRRKNTSSEHEAAQLVGISSLKKAHSKKDQNMDNNKLNGHCNYECNEQKQQTYLCRHAGDWIPSWRQHSNTLPTPQRQNFFSNWGVSSHLKQSSMGNIACPHSSTNNQRSRSYTSNTLFTASHTQKTAHKLHRHK